jgi:formamidopyrimidine-DNA glycosylase
MPELPEVETTRRGIGAHAVGRRVEAVIVRERRLRYPVPRALQNELPGHTIDAIERRGKYLLLLSEAGTVILHLGMSGSLRVVPAHTPPTNHDHLDIVFADGRCLRLRDPRRFGCVLWTRADPQRHRLLRELGPEPLSDAFSGDMLYAVARGRRCAVKALLMDSHIVVGVGNIYANEALFRAGIRPDRAAGRIGLGRYRELAAAVKQTLEEAIRAGGTTLRDFQDSEGRPGYFALALQVYGRTGEPCRRCGAPLRQRVIGQRASYYCAACQR